MPVTDPIHDQRSSPAPTPGGLLAPPFIFDKYSATVMVCSCADSVALPFALCPLPHLPHDVRPGYDADELSFFIHDGHAFDPSLIQDRGDLPDVVAGVSGDRRNAHDVPHLFAHPPDRMGLPEQTPQEVPQTVLRADAGEEEDVGLGHDAEDAVVVVDHGHAAD